MWIQPGSHRCRNTHTCSCTLAVQLLGWLVTACRFHTLKIHVKSQSSSVRPRWETCTVGLIHTMLLTNSAQWDSIHSFFLYYCLHLSLSQSHTCTHTQPNYTHSRTKALQLQIVSCKSLNGKNIKMSEPNVTSLNLHFSPTNTPRPASELIIWATPMHT